jgi:regulator of RNase E activity RraA
VKAGDEEEEMDKAGMEKPVGDALLQTLRRLPTTTLADGMDKLGLAGAMTEIRILDRGMGRMAGRARTVLHGPRRIDAEPGKVYARHIDLVDDMIGPGEVAVIGIVDRHLAGSPWGYLLSLRCQARGAVGAVIDGATRDPNQISELGFPVFVRYTNCAASSKYVLDSIALDEPTFCGGVRVKAGDYIVGDDSGVVVIPPQRAAEVAALAQEVADAEEAIARRIRQGGKVRA